MTITVTQEIQLLSPDALIELFELDATSIGGTISRFHAGTNQLRTSVIWIGNTYVAMPIVMQGFEFTGRGKIPRPTLQMQNVDGLIGAAADTYNDLIGAKVTRKRTFQKYLDAANFPSGTNPTADTTAAFPDDIFYIMRKASHTKLMLEFELAASVDVQGVKIPRRQIIQTICSWQYRSAECSYAGGAVADANDVSTTDLTKDVCGKRITSCQLRFGTTASLPFGGFPGVGAITS